MHALAVREQLHVIGGQAVGAFKLQFYIAFGIRTEERFPCHSGGEVFAYHGILILLHFQERYGFIAYSLRRNALFQQHISPCHGRGLVNGIVIRHYTAILAANSCIIYTWLRTAGQTDGPPAGRDYGLGRLVEHCGGTLDARLGLDKQRELCSRAHLVLETGKLKRNLDRRHRQLYAACITVSFALMEEEGAKFQGFGPPIPAGVAYGLKRTGLAADSVEFHYLAVQQFVVAAEQLHHRPNRAVSRTYLQGNVLIVEFLEEAKDVHVQGGVGVGSLDKCSDLFGHRLHAIRRNSGSDRLYPVQAGGQTGDGDTHRLSRIGSAFRDLLALCIGYDFVADCQVVTLQALHAKHDVGAGVTHYSAAGRPFTVAFQGIVSGNPVLQGQREGNGAVDCAVSTEIQGFTGTVRNRYRYRAAPCPVVVPRLEFQGEAAVSRQPHLSAFFGTVAVPYGIARQRVAGRMSGISFHLAGNLYDISGHVKAVVFVPDELEGGQHELIHPYGLPDQSAAAAVQLNGIYAAAGASGQLERPARGAELIGNQ